MDKFSRVREICAGAAGVDWNSCDLETGQRINRIAHTIPTHPNPMRDPKSVERHVDQIIKDIRSLRKRISGLDTYAKSYARRTARRGEEIAPEEWVDLAALRHVNALEAAMQELGARAIELTPTGAGRPKNKHAHDVALAAAYAFKELTGNDPTFWNEGSTPFSRMVGALFEELGIKAKLRGPIEAAMQKFNAKG